MPTASQPRALIVEDDAAMEAILSNMLERHGFEIETCRTGAEATKAYRLRSPDFIVLDWNLPDTDGLTICREIRASDPSRSIYILMSTANSSTQHLRTALDAGVDDYLAKPFTMELLDVRLRIALQRMHDRRSRQQAETAMFRNQELIAVGTLASGITHEFNNINAIVLGNLDLALTDSSIAESTGQLLDAARQAIRRSTTLTRQLLTFVGEEGAGLQIANLNQILENMLSILSAEYASAGITLETRMGDAPFCALDPGGIGQVMLHLLMNARHAVEGQEVKHITMETGSENDFCYFRIIDNGCGIAEADRDKIFLPFFSRKGEHAIGNTAQSSLKGAGLGLAVSDTIVRHHGGHMDMQSVVGTGSTFTVWLPLRHLDGSLLISEDTPARRILLLDIRSEIVRRMQNLFGDSGHKMYTTGDYGMAIAWHKKTPFDVIIMPAPRDEEAIGQRMLASVQEGDEETTVVLVYPEVRREEALGPENDTPRILRLLAPLGTSDFKRLMALIAHD